MSKFNNVSSTSSSRTSTSTTTSSTTTTRKGDNPMIMFFMGIIVGMIMVFLITILWYSPPFPNNNNNERMRMTTSESSSSSSVALLDKYLPCPRVSETVRLSKVFPSGKLLARRTLTYPNTFWISSHDSHFDYWRWKIIEQGVYYEQALTNVATKALKNKQRGIVLDVGANIGWLSLVAASLGHQVLSFEPNPANQMRLCQSILLNGWTNKNIDVYPNAISDVPGEMSLSWHGNPGGAKLQGQQQEQDAASTKGTKSTTIPVSVLTLDMAIEEAGLFNQHPKPNIYFLKVDVESFEPNVFRGATKLLESGMVWTILHEISVEPTTSDAVHNHHKEIQGMFRQLLNANYIPRYFADLIMEQPMEFPVPFTKTSTDDELETIIQACAKGEETNQCDLIWDHQSVLDKITQ